MRTMASVWFSVIVLVSIHNIFGNCQKNIKDFTCNECIRQGGNWCNVLDPNKSESTHCELSLEDDWCPEHRELFREVEVTSKAGKVVNPIYAERPLYIGIPNVLDIQYTAKSKQKAELKIMHTTQSTNIELEEYETKCIGMNCKTTIKATPSTNFCNATGGISEYVVVKINLGLEEDVLVKYFVPCACECSHNVEKSSPYCHKYGDFSCGVCTCYPGRTGEFCEKPICDEKRGDVVQCSVNPRNDADCSGNGYCGECETCICYTDREGSQYFDQENNCADLCMVASECEDCLLNHTIGECDNCIHSMTIQTYNESLTYDRDELNRKVWVSCNETIADCRIDYVARKSENEEIYVMVVRSCNDKDAAAIMAGPQVSIILGILGLVAAVAAVGGIMLWKHMNTVPPVPLTDPQYQNIDAEDCTGENPLYKPPTSSFKNPTYGKW